MSPTRHWNKELFSAKETQPIYGKYCLLKASSHTWSRDEEVLEAWLFTRQTSADEENSKEDWAVVLESWNGSRRIAASLSLFYRYYFGHCSDELATCIPPPMARPRSTRQATFAHNYCVELSNVRINRFSDGFFPSTSYLWNSLPSSVFPASFNLPSFKRQVYHHLRGQMAWFFFLLHFLDVFY